MSGLKCNLFGFPQLTQDGQAVLMPFVKMSALLYYMIVNRKAGRSEIAGLLWPEESDQTARKNLRNAIYRLHQTLGCELILAPNKTVLEFNDAVELETDVGKFSAAPADCLALYRGEFLQGFSLRGASEYENWIMRMRSFYENLFVASCYRKVEADLDGERYGELEPLIRRLIDIDEYDERSCRLLMRYYQKTGRSGKAIETYNGFSRMLRRELGVDPDTETRQVYEQSLKRLQSADGAGSADTDHYFYGRDRELALLQRTLRDFGSRSTSRSILLQGEPGSGKAAFREKLLEEAEQDFHVLRVECFLEERDLVLRPWSRLSYAIEGCLRETETAPPAGWDAMLRSAFPDFGTFFSQKGRKPEPALMSRSVHSVIKALETISGKQKILMAVNNLQWMDEASLRLLAAVLLESDPLRVMLFAVCDLERSRALEDLTRSLQREDRLTQITLERFEERVCRNLILEQTSDDPLDEETVEQIFRESEGTPFFLNEQLAMLRRGEDGVLSDAMRKKLGVCFLYLSEETLRLLRLASLFRDPAPLGALCTLLGLSRREARVLLEEAEQRALAHTEEKNGRTFLAFSHVKLREYLYESQSPAERTADHLMIGELMEQETRTEGRSVHRCMALAYHFGAANAPFQAFKYQLEALKLMLNVRHEMFPVLDPDEERTAAADLPRTQIEPLLMEMEGQIDSLRTLAQDPGEAEALSVEFFYLRGRHNIRVGAYEQGVRDISLTIEGAQKLGQSSYVLEGYKQMALYYLQLYDAPNMRRYVELALSIAAERNDHLECAICCRLKALCCYMGGEFPEAEDLLQLSIRMLSLSDAVAERYKANIAAAQNYLGEIRLTKGGVRGALGCFREAMALCEGKKVSSSLAQFHINAGRALYLTGDSETARKHFEQALTLQAGVGSFWRRTMTESYLAMICAGERQYRQALEHLASAQETVGHIKSPEDFGTMMCARAVIRKQADTDTGAQRIFRRYLSEDAGQYYRQATGSLNRYVNRCELSVLKKCFPQG